VQKFKKTILTTTGCLHTIRSRTTLTHHVVCGNDNASGFKRETAAATVDPHFGFLSPGTKRHRSCMTDMYFSLKTNAAF
jgi:hypothetical protein